MNLKGSMVILLMAILLGAGLLLAGCELEGKEEGAQLPTRGYGTFKMHVDDVGPVRELSETGTETGRRGFYADYDQDGESDHFYQIDKPSGGIVALSFSPVDGFADGALPIAMSRFWPGYQDYEIPLESLTSWIKIDQVVGYRKGDYVDEPNYLVYNDRVNDEELEAAMTGQRQVFDMYLVSAGVVDPGRAGASSAGEPHPAEEGDEAEDGADITPAAIGEEAEDCDKWEKLCNFEDECGLFGSNWSVADCKRTLYQFSADPKTLRYFKCADNCRDEGCQGFTACQKTCWEENLPDVFGCSGQYGPIITDVIYVVRRGNNVYRVGEGYTLSDGEQLAVYFEYTDPESDFGGGKLVVNFGNGEKTLSVPGSLGRSSFEDKAYIGFTVDTPVASGDYEFTAHLVDAGCGNVGDDVTGKFSSGGQNEEVSGELGGFRLGFEMFEIYDRGLDILNVGRGFVDVRSVKMLPNRFLYELMQFDVAIVQAYIWTFTGTDKFYDLNWDAVNKLIFTTTHDTRGTKWDETDDLQAMAFYIDQPMSSGLFTFYGDEGWNIYPVAPYGDNEDQPFMRGDFENTRIHVPYEPIYQVNPEYTGCYDSCEYWIDYIYNMARNSVRGYSSADEALAACKANSADAFWRGLFTCYKKAEAGINGCVSLDSCVDDVPDESSTGPMCDYVENIPLLLRAKVSASFAASPTYAKLLTNTENDPNWRPLKIGVIAQNADTGAWMALPGYRDLEYPSKEDYTIPLPYMPLVSNKFIQISSDASSMQSQLYPAIFDLDPDTGSVIPYGSGMYDASTNDNVDEDWFYLLVYTWNWADGEQEGWTLGYVAGNTIYGWVNPYETIVELNFGDLRATGGTSLQP